MFFESNLVLEHTVEVFLFKEIFQSCCQVFFWRRLTGSIAKQPNGRQLDRLQHDSIPVIQPGVSAVRRLHSGLALNGFCKSLALHVFPYKRGMMPHRFGRPVAENSMLASFLDEAGRLRAFVPPFRFTSFFSPEDTLLCAVASEAALSRARSPRRANGWIPDPMRIAELTTGSGLVGLYLLLLEHESRLAGLDVDPTAVSIAARNARLVGASNRARFDCADLWSDTTVAALTAYRPHLVICNPPYVPEPPGGKLEIEAGAGPDGTAHLMRTIELADKVRPRSIALSWCSLSDPGRVIREAESIGYSLNSLFVVAIADGEYSGSVHDYLRSLPKAFICEGKDTIDAVAPDGSGRFAYLLMAGDFSRARPRNDRDEDSAHAVERICREFCDCGLSALRNPIAPVPVRTWLLDRWDELRLCAYLHGENDNMSA